MVEKSDAVRAACAVVAVLAVAVVLRLFAITDGFWLDEIWSWDWQRKIDSWLDVFTRDELKHDNNHQLNTLWIYLLGDQDRWYLYRLPSLAAGLVTILLVIEYRSGVRGVLIPGLMFAVSFPMLVYSTEARGYAMAICFALVSFRLLERREAEGFALRTPEVAAHWAAVILAFSSHFVASHYLIGVLLWTGIRCVRRQGFGPAVARLAWLHGVPIAYVGWLWLTVVRHLEIGGGSGLPFSFVFQDVLAWMSGTPNALWFGMLGAGALFALGAFETVARAREDSDQWAVLAGTGVVAPVGILAVTNTEGILYPRFFLVSIAFVTLFAARGLVRLFAGSGRHRTVALLLLALFFVGHLVRDFRFLTEGGRGQYRELVMFMAERSPQEFWVGGDFDFRVLGVLAYYNRFVPQGKRLRYMRDAPKQAQGPHWFLVHDIWFAESQWPPRNYLDVMRLPGGSVYEKVRTFPFYGPSGFAFVLYRRRE